jgi:hypothetical protein
MRVVYLVSVYTRELCFLPSQVSLLLTNVRAAQILQLPGRILVLFAISTDCQLQLASLCLVPRGTISLFSMGLASCWQSPFHREKCNAFPSIFILPYSLHGSYAWLIDLGARRTPSPLDCVSRQTRNHRPALPMRVAI